jgi:hypothetical protein
MQHGAQLSSEQRGPLPPEVTQLLEEWAEPVMSPGVRFHQTIRSISAFKIQTR